jgi:hypothetical protein
LYSGGFLASLSYPHPPINFEQVYSPNSILWFQTHRQHFGELSESGLGLGDYLRCQMERRSPSQVGVFVDALYCTSTGVEDHFEVGNVIAEREEHIRSFRPAFSEAFKLLRCSRCRSNYSEKAGRKW